MDDIAIPTTKTFAPLKKPSKKAHLEMYKRETFIAKLAEGTPQADAAILAGYRGHSPESFAQNELRRPEVKNKLGDLFEKKAKLALKKMTKEKADKMSYLQLAQASATMFDKSRLARGESTSNTMHVNVNLSALSDEELQRYLEEKSRAASTGGK